MINTKSTPWNKVPPPNKIKAGDPLIRFDRTEIEKKGYCTDVMLIVMDNDSEFDVKYSTGMTAEAGKTVVAEY